MQSTLPKSQTNLAPASVAPNRKGQDAMAPDVVMLHGLFGQLSNFEPIFEKIDISYNVWVPALPLYVPEGAPVSIQEMAEWLEDWMRQRGIGSATLVGNSLGGHVAAYLAHMRPGLVDALVLVGSSGLYEAEFGDSVPRRFDRDYIRVKASEAFHDYAVDDHMVDGILEVITDRDKLARVLLWARSARGTPLHGLLPRLTQPVALIWGADDRITPPFVAEQFASLIPAAELHWIPDCGHVPMMERPGAFASVLNAFLIHHVFPGATALDTTSSSSIFRLNP